MSDPQSPVFTSYQKFVLTMLAFLQFTVILDFMILSPLGAVLMPTLNITASQFGLVVSAYAFSAGLSGFLTAGFADRYDRKKLLLFFYAGFILGTLSCGIAPTYPFLVAARIVTGIFGGVIGSIVMAIATDLFSFEIRGRVMGVIQTAFAGSQILGLPIGLYLSNHWGWHAPFLMIVGVASLVGILIYTQLKPIDGHLKLHPDRSALHHLVETLKTPRYILAYMTTALLSLGGFMLMPFSSAFTVHNLGISLDHLPLIYLVTGLASMIMGPLIGRMSDRFGKLKTFFFGSLMSATMVFIYTHLGIISLPLLIAVNVLLFLGIFSRMIPAQTLMSAIPPPTSRGAVMSVSASLQQIAGGLASTVSGLIVVAGPDGVLQHFDTVGYVMMCTTLVAAILMYFVNQLVERQKNDAK